MTGWITCGFMFHDEVPSVAACYVVQHGRETLYVGQTQNLKKRFKQHGFCFDRDGLEVTPWGKFVLVNFKVFAERRFGDRLMREAGLIRRLKPKFNRSGKGGRP